MSARCCWLRKEREKCTASGIMTAASVPSKQPQSWSLVACYQKRGGRGMLDAWQWCVQHGRADKIKHCTLNVITGQEVQCDKCMVTEPQSLHAMRSALTAWLSNAASNHHGPDVAWTQLACNSSTLFASDIPIARNRYSKLCSSLKLRRHGQSPSITQQALTSCNLEGRRSDRRCIPGSCSPGRLHLLHRGGQLIELGVAALQCRLARHQLGHMLPEVSLAGLHRQVGSLQRRLLILGPALLGCSCRGSATGGWLPIGSGEGAST